MNTVAAAPLVRIPSAFLAATRRGLGHGRSPVDSAMLLRQVGYESGEAFHAALEEWVARERGGSSPGSLPQDEFWAAFEEFWEEMGWGTVRHQALHAGIGALDCTGWTEAAAARDAGEQFCHFSTGVFADLLGRVAGTEVAVMEVECEAAGGGRCRFLFGGAAALGGVYEGMSQGLSWHEALSRLA
ncbi:MAG TPA: V4R domain-containing protein [Longimicrobiaceae bacterium]